VRVLDRNGTGYAAWVIRGIIWATDKGADVISMSFGGFDPSPAMAAAVAYARRRGVVVLGSAGNDGENAPFYPASFPGVIGVAASDVSNRPYRWSNRGRWFELAAPGCFYTTTARRGYANFCGTSASTPLVAGIVGLMRAVRPDLPGYMIERALLSTATKVGYVTHGIPNAPKAIDAARRMQAPAPRNQTHAWVERSGVVTIEAERANRRIGRTTIDWINATVKPGYVGKGYVAAWADKGLSRPTNYAATSAELRYHVQFNSPGIYSVWIRAWSPNGGGNSVHVGVNGRMLKRTDKMTALVHGAWHWTRSTMDGAVAHIAITKPGIHTINVWAREDGFRFDRIVVTRGAAPKGLGPRESRLIAIPKR
jgi:Subtilase family/Gylcosyl hydrolase family 115 C-terminal domain